MIEGPTHVALLVFAAVAGMAVLWPVFTAVRSERRRRLSIALHRQGWTHGQIAHELDCDPRQVVRWLASEDRPGGS
ncbi:MAG: hypothetical protein DI531_08055 [Brevundimonas sp.]|nr:MAG: hypothetical protein DI531_08055 [Brevundimonas sp.]